MSPAPSAQPAYPPALVLLLGVLAISTGAIFARLAEAPALVIAASRTGLATLCLAPFAWRSLRHELPSLSRRDRQATLGAGICLALHFATWITSLEYTSVATSVVLVSTHPLWVGLGTLLFQHDRVSRHTAVSIVLSVLGSLIIGAGERTHGTHALWGDGLALAGGLCAAGYLLLGRQVRQQLSLPAYATLCYGSAAILLWACVLALRFPVTGFRASTYAALLALALIPQLLGHTSYNWALKWRSPSLVAVSLLGEPLGSAAWAYLLFGETVTWTQCVGGVCILGAIALAAKNA